MYKRGLGGTVFPLAEMVACGPIIWGKREFEQSMEEQRVLRSDRAHGRGKYGL